METEATGDEAVHARRCSVPYRPEVPAAQVPTANVVAVLPWIYFRRRHAAAELNAPMVRVPPGSQEAYVSLDGSVESDALVVGSSRAVSAFRSRDASTQASCSLLVIRGHILTHVSSDSLLVITGRGVQGRALARQTSAAVGGLPRRAPLRYLRVHKASNPFICRDFWTFFSFELRLNDVFFQTDCP